MEMNEKKVISEVEEVVKPMSQLSIDEIKTLPIYDLKLVRNHNRKTNRTSYYYLFNLGGLNISDRLEESEYKLILLKKKYREPLLLFPILILLDLLRVICLLNLVVLNFFLFSSS